MKLSYNAAAAAAAAAQTFIYSLQTATDIKCFAWKHLFAAGKLHQLSAQFTADTLIPRHMLECLEIMKSSVQNVCDYY